MTHLPEETVLEMLRDSVDCRVPVRLRSDLEMMLRTYQQQRRLLLAEQASHDWTSRFDRNQAKIAACEELLRP